MKLAFAVVLVAASASAQTLAPVSHTACGPMDVKFQIKIDHAQQSDLKVEPGKALVYVIQDQRFKAVKDVTVRIGLDGAWVGATRGNSHLSFLIEPGEHHLCASVMPGLLDYGRTISLFGLTAEAGKVYYLRALTTGGRSSALYRDDSLSVDLDLANRDEGRFLLTFSPTSVSHPTDKDGNR